MKDRRSLLEECPVLIGGAWARSVCDSMHKEGRAVAGGWPGTLVEARARITSHMHEELSGRGMKALEPDELDQVVSATYARAKLEWFEAERRTKRIRRPATNADD